MADLTDKIATARKAGYTDAQITAYLASDAKLGGQIKTAKGQGYNDAAIISHLSKATPKPPENRSLGDRIRGTITGIGANLNRGLLVGDEIAAGLQTASGVAEAVVKGQPISPRRIADRYQNELATQRQREDRFSEDHPLVAAGARGAGFAVPAALSMVATGGASAPAVLAAGSGSRAVVPVAANALARGTPRAVTALNALARPATTGAAEGMAYGLADRGNKDERLAAGRDNAMIGAGLGVAGKTAVGALSKVASWGASQPVVQQALRRVGVTFEQLAPAAQQRIQQMVSQGIDPEQAALHVAAQSLPIPVPVSRGQMSGSPRQQLQENLALRGAKGERPARIARDFRDTQQEALQANAEAIQHQVSGGPVPYGQGGELASDALNTARDTAKRGVNAAYDAARAAPPAVLPAYDGRALAGRMLQRLESYDPQRVSSVYRVMERLTNQAANKDASLTQLFRNRERLSVLRRSGDSVEAGAAAKAIEEFDGFMRQALDEDLIKGDPAGVKAWRDAIASRREFGKLFEGNDLIQRLTEREFRSGRPTLKLAPEEAANYIFGRTALGWAGKRNLSRDLVRLRDTLGADSPEWNQLRGEWIARNLQSAEGAMEGGVQQFSGAKFAKSWGQARRRAGDLVDIMLTPEERQAMDTLAAVSARVTNPVKGGDNSSNTATASKALQSFGSLPVVREMLAGLQAIPLVKPSVDAFTEAAAAGATRRATYGARPAHGGPRMSVPVPENALVGATGATANQARLGYEGQR